ncbi:MAG: type II secretion system protein [Bacilli bacterium]|nr:type II secretion system protein [Bacilli bacterium]
MIKLNNKGFTLVELLAVIVVLAIIMIVAVPAVLNTMNDAQRSTFKLYAERVLNKAQEKYQADLMLGETENRTIEGKHYCYTLSDMELSEKSTYAGYVVVELDKHLKPKFYVTLSDNNFSIANFTYTILSDDPTLGEPLSNAEKIALICPENLPSP